MGVVSLEEGTWSSGQAAPGTQAVPAASLALENLYEGTREKGKEEGKTGLVSRLLFGLCVLFCFWVGAY